MENPSKHFSIGTFVLHNKKRYEVIDIISCKCMQGHTYLRLRDEHGRLSNLKPIALNRR